MALTADQVVVRLHAEIQQYQKNLQAAGASADRFDKQSAAALDHAAVAAMRFDLKASTSLAGLEKSFANLGKGAVQSSVSVISALDKMATNQGAKRLSEHLDDLIRKQIELGDAGRIAMTRIVPGNLPGLGGAGWFKPITEGADRASKSVAASFRDMSRQTRAQFINVGNQVQDVFVQVASGTPISRALAQQLPQLASGFGLVGVAMGTVAAIGIPLVASLIGIKGESVDLNKQITALAKALEMLREAHANAAIPVEQLTQKYGALADEMARVYQNQIAIAQQEMQRLGESIRKTITETANLSAMASRFDSLKQAVDAGVISYDEYIRSLRDLDRGFGFTIAQALQYQNLMDSVASARGPEQNAQAWLAVHDWLVENREELTAQGVAVDDLIGQTNDLAKSYGDAHAAASEITSAANAGAAATDSWKAAADNLAASLRGAASAASAAAANIGALIGANNRAAGLGGLGALDPFSASSGRALTAVAGGMNIPQQADFDRQWRAQVKAQEEAAKAAERLANRKSRGGGAKTTPQQRAVERFDDRILKEIEALNAEADALARLPLGYDEYGNAVAAARKEAEMLQDLQNKGVKLTPQLREQVRNLALDWYEVADAAAQARERHQEFESQLEGFRSTQESAFKGLITGAESFSSALSKVLDKLADIALSSAFDNLWGAGLGKASGGLLGGIFAGFRASGGPVMAGKAYVVGEKGPEPFVPAVNGRILSVSQAQAALRGGQGGSAPKITINNNAPGAVVSADYVTKDEVILTVSQAIASNNRRQSDQQYLRGGR